MSLDLHLNHPSPSTEVVECTCSECGHTHTRQETQNWRLWSTNITHNLEKMFYEAGVSDILWRGDGLVAGDQIPKLEAALADMRANPAKYKQHDAPNGWGVYKDAVPWLEEVIAGFKAHPEAIIACSR